MSFKVIDGGGPDKEDRERVEKERQKAWEREQAEAEFSYALRECAANMLRIIRGAGSPFYLVRQMQEVIRTSLSFHEVHGYWPQDVLAKVLHLESEAEMWNRRLREGHLDQASFDRWTRDGSFEMMDAEHTIYRGVLQIVASEMLGQATQQSAGDREFHDGLRTYNEAHDAHLRKFWAEQRNSAPAPAKGSKRVSPTSPPERQDSLPTKLKMDVAPAPQKSRSRKFDQNDLKELRKAIKANDKKRIAELTAKIGQPEN
ncbi:hypothetical protein BRADO0487 [Bradyrhizobium sp. ORS 278]|uniref:hypothetical protein n=1 Tax=Bradyrhizobium sp. (strain ORS 278) TaxID=114615 RepID=UPI000150784C|nr:hypothetical protein [Bradyrhizobium sp. ORS 278]CAL74427.1 hypothetical protein BRADO0487 [Bradyrhizobium sp. ORS 278]